MEHPTDEKCPSSRHYISHPAILLQPGYRCLGHPAVQGHEIHPVLSVLSDYGEDIISSHAHYGTTILDSFNAGLIDGYGTHRHGAVHQNSSPDSRDVAPGAQIHHSVGTKTDGSLQLPQLGVQIAKSR